MADEEPKEAGEGEQSEKTGRLSKKKKILIVAVLLVLVLGGVAGAYFGGFIGGDAKEENIADAEEGEHGEAGTGGTAKAAPVYYSLPEFLVNLNTNGKQTSFLKMQVSLELASQADVAGVEANVPRIQDSFNTYLRELRPSDLSGSAGIYRLKQELLLRLNKTLAPTKVNDILFKEILVQ